MATATMIFFLIFIPFLAFALLALTVLLAPNTPYKDKNQSFECGFSSFRGQNRQEFSISFFIFGLVFLILDLEILLVYPYTVSSYNNSYYGLGIVFIFLLILTAGFVFELGKKALKIESKQSGYLASSNLEVTLSNKVNLYPYQRRMYSSMSKNSNSNSNTPGSTIKPAKASRSSDKEFWRKVKLSGGLDNQFIIVNKFLKEHPKNGLAQNHINLKLIISILSRHSSSFDLTQEEFGILIKITPVRLELPIKYKDALVKLVGKYTRYGERGIAGVYVFTNKINGNCYVGSSISLANRLSTGYFGPKLGKRKIDLAIIGDGLDSFYLDLYILPWGLVEKLDITLGNRASKIKNLTLALEQIHLLDKNPEYNVLKVAGSPAGIKRSPESMLPSILKSSKPVYLYDTINKQLVYTANSQTSLAKLLGIGEVNMVKYTRNNNLYLSQFIISNTPISPVGGEEYTVNLLEPLKLKELVKGVGLKYRKYLASLNLSKTRQENILKVSKQVKLTNIITNEVAILASRNETARYLKNLGYKCSAGTVSDGITKGRIYKKTFKFEEV